MHTWFWEDSQNVLWLIFKIKKRRNSLILSKATMPIQQIHTHIYNCFELTVTSNLILYCYSYLYTGHSWWQHQSHVVPMYHGHDANRSGGQTPWILIHILLLLRFRVLNHDLKHLGEVLTKMMGCAPLNGTPTGADVGLYRRGEVSTGKLLFLCFATSHNRDSQQLLIDSGIQLQDLIHLARQSRPIQHICVLRKPSMLWGGSCRLGKVPAFSISSKYFLKWHLWKQININEHEREGAIPCNVCLPHFAHATNQLTEFW